MKTKMEAAQKDAENELAKILSEKQMARLKQIAKQVQGPQALLAPETSKKLELTKDQIGKIKDLTRKDEKKLRRHFDQGATGKWKEMIGPAFHGMRMKSPAGMAGMAMPQGGGGPR